MANNPVSRSSVEWLGSSGRTADITPHVSTVFEPTRGISANTLAGAATVRFDKDTTDRVVYLQLGVVYPYSVTSVRASGTAATGLVAHY